MTLERLLVARAVDWAVKVAPGRVYVGHEPAAADPRLAEPSAGGDPRLPEPSAGGVAELFALSGEGTSRRLQGAVDRVLAAAGAPLLVAWPELPRWRRLHADTALEDLAAGCDLSVGPVFDGGFYMLALGRPIPELFTLSDDAWRGPEAMGLALGAAHEAGLQVGLLRAERGLRREADVRAALADPLVDEDLRRLLK